jgi:para-nitrobenzyl esterase
LLSHIQPKKDEDCLYLNIYAPREADISNPLPVLFFIYGGSWELGAASYSIYEGIWWLREKKQVEYPK